jgi:hypothetical protein
MRQSPTYWPRARHRGASNAEARAAVLPDHGPEGHRHALGAGCTVWA